MAYLTIAVLALSVTFFALRYRPGSSTVLPRWLRPARRRLTSGGKNNGVDSQQTTSEPNRASKGPKVTVEIDDISDAEDSSVKAATGNDRGVPTFALDEGLWEKQAISPTLTKAAPSFLGPNSARRASSIPPAREVGPTTKPNTSTTLMPPPPRPRPVPPQNSPASLRVPSTGPLPNRGPPPTSQQRASGGLSPNGVVSTPNKRGKVLLSPGHSPMDWAALTRSKTNLSGVETFQRVTPSKLKSMTGRKGKPAWSSWQGKVYNLTPFLPFHPGGEAELMKAAGRDGGALFMEVHPWVNWENMLGACLVGVLVPEGMGEGLEGLD